MRVPFALSCLALVTAGCASESVAFRSAPELSVAALATPAGAEDSGGWSEVEPATTVVRSSEPAAGPGSDGWSHHVSLLGGQRWLDDDDWGDLDDPFVAGLEFDGTDTSTGNGFEVGVLYSNDDEDENLPIIGSVEADLTMWELYVGYRYTFDPAEEGLHPFLSLGVDANNGELELSGPGADETEDDLVLGLYARAGLLWDVSDRLRLGLDYRHLFADDYEFDFGGGEVEAESDHDQVVLSLGWAY